MVMMFKLNIFFVVSLDLDKCWSATSKETAHNNPTAHSNQTAHNNQTAHSNQTASYIMVMADWKSIPSGNQTHILSF
jgi:hypothetical protein